MIPIHYLYVYQRPAQGSAFVKRYPVYNYQHSISNMGWFDTASCDLNIHSASEALDILDDNLGCFVQIYVDNPMQPIWEGLINRIIYNGGAASYTISLDEMANRVSAVYTGAANAAAETPIVNNLVSQAIYGIKQEQIEFGSDPSGGTQRTVLTNTILAQRAFPQISVSMAMGQANVVHLEMVGIFHTLEWVKFFTATSAASTAFGTNVGVVVGADPNGTTFYNNADLSQISANAATVKSQERASSYWERLQKIAEAGDGNSYWVAGILPTDPNTRTRRFYYRQFNSAVEYTTYQKDSLRPRNLYGKVIPSWLVVPDRSIRVNDSLVGFGASQVLDPRICYIQNIQYDANAQQVQWFGTDDTTARAAFQLRRSFKPIAKNMPGTAPTRVIVT